MSDWTEEIVMKERARLLKLERAVGATGKPDGVFIRFRGDGNLIRPANDLETTYTEEYIREYYGGGFIIARPMSYSESLESAEAT